MLHLHLLGLLSFEILVLLASFLFMAYVNKHGLERKFQLASKAIVITMHIVIAGTIIHGIIFHCMGNDHMDMIHQMHGGGIH